MAETKSVVDTWLCDICTFNALTCITLVIVNSAFVILVLRPRPNRATDRVNLLLGGAQYNEH